MLSETLILPIVQKGQLQIRPMTHHRALAEGQFLKALEKQIPAADPWAP